MAKIVVIDDSAVVLKIAEQILTEAGHQVLSFMGGKQALQVLRAEPVDLVVTDIYMPDADGLEVIRNVRQIHPQTPIVAISSATGIRDFLQVARHLGASATLKKPFSRIDLLTLIAPLLAGKTAPRVSTQKPASRPEEAHHAQEQPKSNE